MYKSKAIKERFAMFFLALSVLISLCFYPVGAAQIPNHVESSYRSDFQTDADYTDNADVSQGSLQIGDTVTKPENRNRYFGDYSKMAVYTSRKIEVADGFYGMDVRLDKKLDDPQTRITLEVYASTDGEIWTDSEIIENSSHVDFKSTIFTDKALHYFYYQVIIIADNEKDQSSVNNIEITYSKSVSGNILEKRPTAQKQLKESKDRVLDVYYEKVRLAGQLPDDSIIKKLTEYQVGVSGEYNKSDQAESTLLSGSYYVSEDTDNYPYTFNGAFFDTAKNRFIALPCVNGVNPIGATTPSQWTRTVDITFNNNTITNIPVYDIGPWNVKDDFWWDMARNKDGYVGYPDLRYLWSQAGAAYHIDHHNGWTSTYARTGTWQEYVSDSNPGTQTHKTKVNPNYPVYMLNGAEVDISTKLMQDLGCNHGDTVNVTFNWMPNWDN